MLKPLRDKIIVRPEQRFTSAMLDLSQVKGSDTVGYVVAVGPEAEDVGLSIGDKVHFGTVASDAGNEYLNFEEIKIDGQRHLKMSWQDVCFVEEVE